jgi:hypothetical protein
MAEILHRTSESSNFEQGFLSPLASTHCSSSCGTHWRHHSADGHHQYKRESESSKGKGYPERPGIILLIIVVTRIFFVFTIIFLKTFYSAKINPAVVYTLVRVPVILTRFGTLSQGLIGGVTIEEKRREIVRCLIPNWRSFPMEITLVSVEAISIGKLRDHAFDTILNVADVVYTLCAGEVS